MSVALKIVVGLGLAVAVLLMSATVLVGGAVVSGGVASVSIRTPDSPDLRLAVPGVLITAAAAAIGDGVRHHGVHGSRHTPFLLEDLEHEIDVDLRSVGHLTAELFDVLEDIPDATLVDVVDRGDRVRVIKSGRYLRVEVVDGSGDLDLQVSLPIRTARRTAALLIG